MASATAGFAGSGLLVLAAAVAAAGQPAASGSPASVSQSRQASAAWTAGYCRTDAGVTVVADFTDLGSGIVVRCVPTTPQSGVEALQEAGLAPEGTRQYGLAFICRLAGRPAADEPLAVNGHPGYTEQCQQTPPTSAHWEYWTAPDGGRWTFSDTGVAGNHPIAGGFEGWSFSLNDSHHPPGIAPSRPTPSPTPTAAPTPSPTPTAAPTTTSSPQTSASPSRPSPHRRTTSGHGPGPQARNTPTPTRSAQTLSPTSTSPSTASVAPAPTSTPRTVVSSSPPRQLHPHGQGRPHVKGSHRPRKPVSSHISAPESPAPSTAVSGGLPPDRAAGQSPGSAGATFAGLGLIALVAAGAGITSWRRSRRV